MPPRSNWRTLVLPPEPLNQPTKDLSLLPGHSHSLSGSPEISLHMESPEPTVWKSHCHHLEVPSHHLEDLTSRSGESGPKYWMPQPQCLGFDLLHRVLKGEPTRGNLAEISWDTTNEWVTQWQWVYEESCYTHCVHVFDRIRKPKAKAPPPPAETRPAEVLSVDKSVESSVFIMEQKENMIDKDVELLVVLPGDIIKSTTVHGSKPMMDLLIFLCAKYHLNPSSYTIDLLSAEKNPIKFKPNTPIGMLEVEKVILKPKVLDKKKPTRIIPEKTVRVVINFKKTQKAIVRVNPHTPLQELAPIICDKCEFDPLHTLLLKDYQSQEALDMTKSLNELGLRELYAMDVSRESCQISPNLDMMKERENKGFFSFFQRSKKKREQTASAPTTPLISKPRPTLTRSNTISKQYVSNTLPSNAPKKRRAPLPPMSASQSASQDLAQTSMRPASCIVKSMSVDETNKGPSETDVVVRPASLQLSSSPFGNSSLRRTKRKAPLPPSKRPLHQSEENSHMMVSPSEESASPHSVSEANSPEGLSSPAEASPDSGLSSHKQSTAPVLTTETSASEHSGTSEAAAASLTSGVSSDYSLEEIDEKEELSKLPKDEAENISPKLKDIPSASADIINTTKNDSDSVLGNDIEESSQNSKEEKQETRNTDGLGPHVYNTSNAETAVDSVQNLKSLGSSPKNDQNEVIKTEDNEKNGVRRTEMNVASVAQSSDMDIKVDSLSNSQACKTNTVNYKENDLVTSSVTDQKLAQLIVEKTKMQDATIQIAPPCNSFDKNQQDHCLSDFRIDESVQASTSSKAARASSSKPQNSVDSSREFQTQGTLTTQEDQLTIKEPKFEPGSDDLLTSKDGTDKNANAAYPDDPFYREDYKPTPKPSDEMTRCYIPKIGMTTYKIVPPKSLEILKDGESESTGYKNDQEMPPLEIKHPHENVKETAIQTEGPKKPKPSLKPKPNLGTGHLLHSLGHTTDPTMCHPPKSTPRMTRDPGTAPFAPSLEDINSVLESRLKSRMSNPQAKPSSFFLQMQKRVASQYVTSAAAQSVHAAQSPVPKELPGKEAERNQLPSAESTFSLSHQTAALPPPPLTKQSDVGITDQKPVETSAPPVAPKPVPQLAAQNLKTLKTFGAPRPFSSSPSSTFALAVVKRSQSSSKPHAVPNESLSDEKKGRY
ncbi:PREDICTED: cordon-bleu protein-like 1-like [Elephantulus edwardii]|uniref:cordon-bleu protein-like 1-like n=1 Tax=Elephantulus edwardii TaxID=28737 RepID=UPI0003F0AD6D|nr:PREDICTED: cordon-bleu protein-like 1-like [Elephantulus edwardii]